MPGFFGEFVHNALRALQSDHSSPKSDNFPQKCALIPQNRSFNHISLTFSLTKIIYALLLAKFVKVPGLGGGVNPILAMPAFWVHMDPQPIPKGSLKKSIFFRGWVHKFGSIDPNKTNFYGFPYSLTMFHSHKSDNKDSNR